MPEKPPFCHVVHEPRNRMYSIVSPYSDASELCVYAYEDPSADADYPVYPSKESVKEGVDQDAKDINEAVENFLRGELRTGEE